MKVKGLAAESDRATAGGHSGTDALCSTAAAQGMKREGEGVERVTEVKERATDLSAMRQSGEQRHGRAARDGAAPPPPPGRTAPSRGAAAANCPATDHRADCTKKEEADHSVMEQSGEQSHGE